MSAETWLELNRKDLTEGFADISNSLAKFKFLRIDSPKDVIALREFLFSSMEKGCFKSIRHMKAFMLLNYDPKFNKELGITRRCFVDGSLAKSWMGKMQKEFHPDLWNNKFDEDPIFRSSNQDYSYDEVSGAINSIYAKMMGKS